MGVYDLKTYVFAIYLSDDDLVEIKVQATEQGEALSKVKNILHNYVDTSVTGLYLHDEY